MLQHSRSSGQAQVATAELHGPDSFQPPASYPALAPLIGGRIDVALIRAHWTEILRLALSIRTGTVAASVILRQLGAYPRQNGLALALRELGRLERTLLTLDWLEDPGFPPAGRP